MLTLSNGYKKPQTGDKGSALFTALEFNIQRLNDHTHDGTDSEKLDATSLTTVTDTILAVNWVAFGPSGHYRQQVTMSPGLNFDEVVITVRTSDGKYVYPTIEKVSSTQFFIYSIDNTLDLTVAYGL